MSVMIKANEAPKIQKTSKPNSISVILTLNPVKPTKPEFHVQLGMNFKIWEWDKRSYWATPVYPRLETPTIWVCLEMGYAPNYSHLLGIMRIHQCIWLAWSCLAQFDQTQMSKTSSSLIQTHSSWSKQT